MLRHGVGDVVNAQHELRYGRLNLNACVKENFFSFKKVRLLQHLRLDPTIDYV